MNYNLQSLVQKHRGKKTCTGRVNQVQTHKILKILFIDKLFCFYLWLDNFQRIYLSLIQTLSQISISNIVAPTGQFHTVPAVCIFRSDKYNFF